MFYPTRNTIQLPALIRKFLKSAVTLGTGNVAMKVWRLRRGDVFEVFGYASVVSRWDDVRERNN